VFPLFFWTFWCCINCNHPKKWQHDFRTNPKSDNFFFQMPLKWKSELKCGKKIFELLFSPKKEIYDQILFIFYTCEISQPQRWLMYHGQWCRDTSYFHFVWRSCSTGLFNPETRISFRGQLIVQLDALYAKCFKMPLPMYRIEKVANVQVN
jgi:hypothetical protein